MAYVPFAKIKRINTVMKNEYLYLVFAIIAIAIMGILYKLNKPTDSSQITQPGSQTIHVVAAENFYGDIAKQLGKSRVQVFSLLSDPNSDPHEYESSVRDAEAVAKADVVIRNGENYDTWIDKIISASPNKNRIVLTAVDIATHKIKDNPHVWYGIDNVSDIAVKITETLKKIDPTDAEKFDKNLSKFDLSLQPLQHKIADIKTRYNNMPVGLTETIYLYQTKPEGLNVLTPYSFEKAIAEGNDPSADDVATTNDQITKKQVKILIYNSQTVTPITTNLQNEAKKQNIPIVPISETMPKGKTYQAWMTNQIINLENALQSAK